MKSQSSTYLVIAAIGLYLFNSIFSYTYAVDNPTKQTKKPSIQLASHSTKPIANISDYLISEKLDGVRGYWDGKAMYSRSGRRINLPTWFAKGFPHYPLDGELWSQRGHFEQISATVRKSKATEQEWKTIKFMVFDLPAERSSFAQRYAKAIDELSDKSPYLNVVSQYSLNSLPALDKALDKIISQGGEGLMLHHKNAFYKVGRSQDIVKLKPHYDAEAKVIAYKAGKGQFSGMMGALVVENEQGKVFKLGSGFSKEERLHPPEIGSVVTYKYYGFTQNGIPRFASFLRIRQAQ
ncbi:DNA ligase [Shewanella sp. 125m-7]